MGTTTSSSSQRPVRWGILGAARINEPVVTGCRGSGEHEFVAIASRDEARAQAQARALGVPRGFGSYQQLLEAEDIDAVYVALPNALHVEWSMRALEAGKHVLCEKPFSSNPEAVAEAFALAGSRGLVLAEAFMYGYHPQTELLRNLVSSGRIGEVAFMHAEHDFYLDGPDDFRLSGSMEGGALMDLGCYCLHTARMLLGEPDRVAATEWRFGGETDMRFLGELEFPGDKIATFHCAMDLPEREWIEITGTSGAITLEDPWHCRSGSIRVFDATGKEERVEVPIIDRYRAQFDAVSRAIASPEREGSGMDDAVAQAVALRRLFDEARIAG